MPAPDPPRSGNPEPRPRRDASAIPAFLRAEAGGMAERRETRLERPPALPRPTNPPAPAPPDVPSFDPAVLPMPSLSRRRVITAAGVLLAAWLAVSFARQVGEASAATDRAEELRAANATLRAEIARLEADLVRVQDRRYILNQGRGVGLGARGEVAFALAGDPPPPLPVGAPGSAAARLGSATTDATPLEAWLAVLFGSD